VNKTIEAALNEQINAELHSAYTYLAMSAHFAEKDFDGFSTWMRLQAQEEVAHAMKLYNYVLERGGHVELEAVAAPEKELGTPLKIFQTALAHEQKITGMIHDLYELARTHKDYATEIELNWFVTEQVEEEASAGRAVERLKRAGDNMSALLMLDQQFGVRSAVE
jgi:ferritin